MSNTISDLSNSFFTDDAKINLISPHNKGTSKKNYRSNFRSVRALTAFSETDEEATVKLIDSSMKKSFFRWRNFSLLILLITKSTISS